MLVYNSFEADLIDTVKASFKRENIDLAVIPGGLTFLLQLLDVSLNKLLKMESESTGWLMEFTNLLTLDDKRGLQEN